MYLQNKYTKWYYSIINNAKTRNIIIYSEKHHIIPRSLGGDNSTENIVKLTEAMNLLVTDERLYNYCKENALQSIQHFSIEVIGKQWLDLMNIIS